MASELKVDKFTGVTTAGSILVTGEGNSTTTNLQQGLCKAWIHFDATPSTPTVEESFNTASIVDDAVGNHRVNFTNSFGNVNYINIGCTAGNSGSNGDHCFVPYSDSSGGTTSQTFQLRPSQHEGSRRDCRSVYHMSNGDLA